MHWTTKPHSILTKSLIFVAYMILEIHNTPAIVILKIYNTLGGLNEIPNLWILECHYRWGSVNNLPISRLKIHCLEDYQLLNWLKITSCVSYGQGNLALCPRPWRSGWSFTGSVHLDFGIIRCIIYLSMLRRYKNYTKQRRYFVIIKYMQLNTILRKFSVGLFSF